MPVNSYDPRSIVTAATRAGAHKARALYDRVENKARRVRMGPAAVAESDGQHNRALALWRERLEHNPHDVHARLGVVRCLSRTGRGEQAEVELALVRSTLGDEAPEFIEHLATEAETNEEWAAAAAQWQRLVAARPQDGEAVLALARCQMSQGNHDQARAQFELAAKLGKGRQANRGLAELAELSNDADWALRQWRMVAQNEGQSPDTFNGIARAQIAMGQVETAKETLATGLAAFPSSTQLRRTVGQIAQAQCDFETWEQHLSKMIQIAPGNTFFRTQRALAANNLGDVMLYWRDLDFAVHRYRIDAWNGRADGLANLITTLLRQGNSAEAESLLPVLFDRCVSRPGAGIVKQCADALVWFGDIDGLRFLAETVPVAECSPSTLVELANINVALENTATAFELIDETKSVTGRRAVELQAWAAVHSGDVETAREMIDRLSFPNTLNYYRALDSTPLGGLESVNASLDAAQLAGQVLVMSVVRNEMARLPEWFDHYRSMGATQFVMVDNASDDGTRDFLVAQPDVHLYHAEGYYRHTASGRRWLNEIMQQHCAGAWCLIADADEFMVFQGMEAGIDDLARRLDAEGAETMFAPMIDMHGHRLDDWNHRTPDSTMLDLFPYLDRRTALIGNRNAPYMSVSGGMRNLVLSRVMPESLLSKPAMIKGGRDIVHLTSHTTTPCRPAKTTAAFLHFKFAVDPKPRSTFSSSKGVFARLLASDLAATREIELVTENAVRYEGPDQLAAMGLLRRPEVSPE